MCASEDGMPKIYKHSFKYPLALKQGVKYAWLCGVASACLCVNVSYAQTYPDQSESLRMLEQAVNAPSSTGVEHTKTPIPKRRTRAIVFDANEEGANTEQNNPPAAPNTNNNSGHNAQNFQNQNNYQSQPPQQYNPPPPPSPQVVRENIRERVEEIRNNRPNVQDSRYNPAPMEREPSYQGEMAAQGGAGNMGSSINCAQLPPGVRTINVGFSIQFRVNSAAIAPESDQVLGEIARILSQAKDRCVIIEGHTDASGNWNRNIMLSQDRANSVTNYILDRNNMLRGRLIPLGRGAADPIQNLDPRDFRNRRVVFKVVTG